jgi:hypothetical protein
MLLVTRRDGGLIVMDCEDDRVSGRRMAGLSTFGARVTHSHVI